MPEDNHGLLHQVRMPRPAGSVLCSLLGVSLLPNWKFPRWGFGSHNLAMLPQQPPTPTPPLLTYPRDQEESEFQTPLCHETSGILNKYPPVSRPQL